MDVHYKEQCHVNSKIISGFNFVHQFNLGKRILVIILIKLKLNLTWHVKV